MPKLLLLFAYFIILFTSVKAQTPIKDTSQIKIIEAEDFSTMLDGSENSASSHFDIFVGVGNKLFSVQNNAVNTSQAQVNKLFYTTMLSYHHKSGLGFSAMPYFSSVNGSLKVYQTALTPSYNFSGKKVDFSLSYTRYLADHKSYNSNATYQNDFFTTLSFSKPFLQPFINVGYTTGTFKEINIDTIKFLNNRIVRDSTNNSIKNFSTSVGLQHSFSFENVLQSSSAITITPQILLIAGAQNLATKHTNKSLSTQQNKSKKFKTRTQIQADAFNLQSLAIAIDITYSIGKFSFSPNMYLDYYLHPTTDKRFTSVYSITAGISF